MNPRTQDELSLIFSKFQKIVRKKQTFKKVERLSGIHIEKQSQKNILALYAKLRDYTGLPPSAKEAIDKEKRRSSDALTPSELQFFQSLLSIPLIANHATQNAQAIQNNGVMYSTNQLRKQNLLFKSSTRSDNGEDHFVYFSYGYPSKLNIVQFVGQADIFTINLDNLSRKDPELAASTWTSGHFYAYDQEQVIAPIEYKFAGQSTRVYSRYKATFSPIFKYTKYFVFQRPDGVFQQTIFREDEISANRHIKTYHILRLIEFLRFLDGETRQYILANSSNELLIGQLFDSLFTPGKAELCIPERVMLKNDPSLFSFHPWKNLNLDKSKLHDCVDSDKDLQDNYNKLASYLAHKIPLQFYLYDDHYGRASYSLLNLAVLKKRYDIAHLLLSHGIDANHVYVNRNQSAFLYCAERSALQDAIEMHDMQMIKLLCESQGSIGFCAAVGSTEMYTAIAYKIDVDAFQYLLAQHQKTHIEIDKLLLVAVLYNNIPALIALLQAGANPNVTCDLDYSNTDAHLIPPSLDGTALTVAAERGRSECAKVLLQYRANPNGYIREVGRYHKQGKGNNPLLELITQLKKPFTKSMSIFAFENSDRCFYAKLPKASQHDYNAVVEVLLAAGANPSDVSGKGMSFITELKTYLEKHENSFLQQVYSQILNTHDRVEQKQSESSRYSYESYAIITHFNAEEKQEEVLVGKRRSYRNTEIWGLVGGEADYTRDNNLKDTILTAAGYQVGIDLSTSPSGSPTETYTSSNEDRVELHHFSISATQKSKIYRYTPDSMLFNRSTSIDKLDDIEFIKLSDIKIEMIRSHDTDFPLCTYQERALPYIICVKLATLRSVTNFNIEQANQLALRLHNTPYALVESAVTKHNLGEIASLIQLRIMDGTDISALLEKAIVMNHDDIAAYLIDHGIRLSSDQFNGLFNSYEDHRYSEAITWRLLEIHQHLVNDLGCQYLSNFAGKMGYASIINWLCARDSKQFYHIAVGAMKALNVNAMMLLFNQVPNHEKEKLITDILDRHFPQNHQDNELGCVLDVILFLVEQYKGQKSPSKWLLDRVCSLFEKMAEKFIDSAIQIRCLDLIEKLVALKFIGRHHIYGVYIRLSYDRKKAEPKDKTFLQRYLSIITQIPSVMLKHLGRKKLFNESDDFLNQHYCDKKIRRELIHSNYDTFDIHKKDDKGDDSLQRAIKSNHFNVVKLLVETCFNDKDFHINDVDANGWSPLDNAIRLGYHKIATILKINGAKHSPTYLESVLNASKNEAKEPISIGQMTQHKRESNIMCFGRLCVVSGLAHIVKLAGLIKASQSEHVNKKWIYVVGAGYDETLYELLKAMYPQQAEQFNHKSPSELIKIYGELKHITAELPIKLFLDPEEKEIATLFEECEYTFYPAPHGANLRSSSIRNSLTHGNIIYSHVSDITPEPLRYDGEYNQAMVLFESHAWNHYADDVLSDIKFREKNKEEMRSPYYSHRITLNQKTRDIANQLLSHEIFIINAAHCVDKHHLDEVTMTSSDAKLPRLAASTSVTHVSLFSVGEKRFKQEDNDRAKIKSSRQDEKKEDGMEMESVQQCHDKRCVLM
jgi:ankyrin repeat protein